MAGTLFLVATPIGNLSDMSFRAVDTLKRVARIACEDTRQTRKLLDHFQISNSTVSFHEHNEAARTRQLIQQMVAGDSIALVSDAGTPLLSDPGFRLVEAAIAAGIDVVPIPGPSAIPVALSASGLPTDSFRFGGFLSSKRTQRRRQLEEIIKEEATQIFFEAPHRILETMADIEEILGPDRPVVIARELTKLHEEFLRGPASEIRSQLASRQSVKGEITLLIGRLAKQTQSACEADLRAEVQALIKSGLRRMDAIKQVAHSHGMGKRELYQLLESSHRCAT
jgi:16S rRNA (cytidine1402-2'-O)-methyltransferase